MIKQLKSSKCPQDFLNGNQITQVDYKVISIHLDKADIIEKEWLDKTHTKAKPKLSRHVYFPLYHTFHTFMPHCRKIH